MSDKIPPFSVRLIMSMCVGILWLNVSVANGEMNFFVRGSVNERLALSSVRSETLVNPQRQLVDYNVPRKLDRRLR